MLLLSSLGLACMVGVFSSCGEIKRGEYSKGSETIYCDDGFKNILEEEIEVFEYSNPGATIIPKYVSEGEAVEALMGDTTTAIIITHELDKDQVEYIKSKNKRIVKQQDIAVDAVALIVNKDNPVEMLSVDEVGQILKGDITKWSQLQQTDTTDIKIVFDNPSSSTVLYMRDRFLDGKPISSNPKVHVYAQKNNREVFDAVKKDRNAIGIISVSWLGDSLQFAKKVPVEEKAAYYENDKDTTVLYKPLTTEVKVLPIQNPTEDNDFTLVPYKPYQENIFNKDEYPFVRKIYMVTTASQSTVMKSFYDFITGSVGQKIIMNTGILPARMQMRVVETTRR